MPTYAGIDAMLLGQMRGHPRLGDFWKWLVREDINIELVCAGMFMAAILVYCLAAWILTRCVGQYLALVAMWAYYGCAVYYPPSPTPAFMLLSFCVIFTFAVFRNRKTGTLSLPSQFVHAPVPGFFERIPVELAIVVVFFGLYLYLDVNTAAGTRQTATGVMVAVLIAYLFLTKVMTVGQNSTLAMMIPVLMFFVVAVLLMPRALEAVARLTDVVSLKVLPTEKPVDATGSWWPNVGVFGGITLTRNGIDNMMARVLTSVVTWAIMMDDVVGPRDFLEGIMRSNPKREITTLGWATVSSSKWIIAVGLDIIWNLIIMDASRLMETMTGAVIGTILQRFVLSRFWVGRGQQATAVDTRAGMLYVLGDGPLGARRLLLTASLFIVAFVMFLGGSGNYAVCVLFLSAICISSPRVQLGVLGIISGKLTLLVTAFMSKNPLDEDIKRTGADTDPHDEGRLIGRNSATVGKNSTVASTRKKLPDCKRYADILPGLVEHYTLPILVDWKTSPEERESLMKENANILFSWDAEPPDGAEVFFSNDDMFIRIH